MKTRQVKNGFQKFKKAEHLFSSVQFKRFLLLFLKWLDILWINVEFEILCFILPGKYVPPQKLVAFKMSIKQKPPLCTVGIPITPFCCFMNVLIL